MAGPEVELDLSVAQARVLGALLEKQHLIPDAYPMTLNALVTACNQTTNRDPVIKLEASTVEMAVSTLKAKGLARVVHPGLGERATKYRHVADEALGLDSAEVAVVCLLLLRGAQTAGELKGRTERLHGFRDAGDVEATLERLARRPEPLVTRVERMAGQKEDRWIQLLEVNAVERAVTAPTPGASPALSAQATVAGLERRLAALETLVESLIEALGDLVQLDRTS